MAKSDANQFLLTLFILLVYAVLHTTQYSDGTYFPAKGNCGETACIIGKPMTVTINNSLSECFNKCSTDILCTGFNFKRSNGACELFNSSFLQFENNVHCISWHLLHITSTEINAVYPHDCSDILKRNSNSTSRTYSVKLVNEDKVIQVYCDMETDGGGWTVFQRRIDGSEAFNRTWNEFADGFGNMCKEFWLGNDNLAAMTNAKSYQLRIDLGDFNGQYRYATYNNFRIGSAAEKYSLTFTNGSYSGDAGDSLTYHWGMKFSTYDNDNDLQRTANCASMFFGAWWYKGCLDCNLHGIYNSTKMGKGVNWYRWLGGTYSLRFAEMKIRPQPF